MSEPHIPHVVIAGVGFGGLGVMKKLKKAPVKVTVIDQNDYHTFLPLLYQVASGELARTEVGFPIREMLHGHESWAFHRGAIQAIDVDAKVVTVDGFAPISFDYLVIGLGAVVNFFGTKGAAEHAFPLYTLADAVKLKTHILQLFESVDKDPSLIEDGALRIVIVGGGATGVETAGALSELITAELKNDYPNLPVDKAEVHVYEHSPHLLGPFKPKLQEYAKKALEDRDVHVHLGDAVDEVAPTRVKLRSGEEIKAHTLVWAAGLKASPIAEMLGAELDRGRVVVGEDLSLKDHPTTFVIGDIAMITDHKTKEKLPQLGSVAQQAGYHAGESIARLVSGKGTEPFKYLDKGTMATVGHGAAVVQMPRGRTMTGHAAWLAWLGIHLTLLSGGEERGTTMVDWGWELLTHERGKRIVIE